MSIGWFDPCALPLATFDETAVPLGWFHRDFVDQQSGKVRPKLVGQGGLPPERRKREGVIVYITADILPTVTIDAVIVPDVLIDAEVIE